MDLMGYFILEHGSPSKWIRLSSIFYYQCPQKHVAPSKTTVYSSIYRNLTFSFSRNIFFTLLYIHEVKIIHQIHNLEFDSMQNLLSSNIKLGNEMPRAGHEWKNIQCLVCSTQTVHWIQFSFFFIRDFLENFYFPHFSLPFTNFPYKIYGRKKAAGASGIAKQLLYIFFVFWGDLVVRRLCD